MPAIIDPNPHRREGSISSDKDYMYQYPGELDLKPGSPLHEKLRRRILDRAQESWEVISQRHTAWDKVEDTCTAFMPLDEKERQVQRMDSRRPVSIVVPLSYAVKETLLAHLISIFSMDGIWQYEARGPEDVGGVALMENLVDAQSKRFKHLLALHTFFQDGISKGIGVVAPVWETKYGLRDQVILDPMTGMPVASKQEHLTFEGNRLRNINPRLYLPDPNVPAHEVQDGEAVGWVWRDSQIGILEEEQRNPGAIFNAKYLQHIAEGRSQIFKGRDDTRQTAIRNTRPVDRIYMYERIIPAEVGLGPSEFPEIWCFQLAADEVIIGAQPLGLNHNMFPLAVCAPDYDGYSCAPIARLEVTLGLQGVADFLYNSHIAHCRKSLNGVTVVDPSVININDMTAPGAHKLIRVRRSMFGMNAIDKGFKQFPVSDPTTNHVSEVGMIDSLIAKITGASDSMQGVFSGGERKSAQEARDTYLSGIGRVEKMARIISEQAMGDLGYMIAKHTQQFLSQESYVNITGRLQEDIMELYGLDPMETRIPVGPQDLIDVDFDAIVRDGTMPSSSFTSEHIQLMQLAIQDPRVYQTFDTARWMAEIAKSMGIKNINDFKFKTTVMPTADVAGMAESGELVPAG
jgi:hypothetical protein